MQQLKQRIARQFSRAAGAYDAIADVQADIAFDALGYLAASPGTLLDLGCGTGRYVQHLAQRTDRLVGIDIAQGMLTYARQTKPDSHWICADAEALPLTDGSIDSVFSSMALQWCCSTERVMGECARVMCKGARGILAIMSDGSFPELNQCWLEADAQRTMNHFYSRSDWHIAAQHAGLKVSSSNHIYTSWHHGLTALLNSIRQIGANTVTHTAHKPLTRATLRTLEQVYHARFGSQGKLPLSYHVVFLEVVKPHD